MGSVLVINCGSSSVKFALFSLQQRGSANADPVCDGIASRVDEDGKGQLSLRHDGQQHVFPLPGTGHDPALSAILAQLRSLQLLDTVQAVGHRVVHGGDLFRAPTLIDTDAEAAIERCCAYAPLHNPANLLGIRSCRQRLPGITQIAVFDTAFHSTLPPVAFHYALPHAWYQEWGVRRYGFHGINHQYVSTCLPGLLNIPPEAVRAVSAHLGNGCSLCAIKGTSSVDTSMGFTPLEGLMMGSRSGDLDPGLHEYLCEQLGVNIKTLTAMLNREAGLKGVSGVSNDMRQCLQAAEAGNAQAQLAVDLFCYRLAKQIAACIVPLGRINAIAFTGGIGENAAPVRTQVIQLLQGLGFGLDTKANAIRANHPRNIAAPNSPAILIVPAQEEWLIAQETANLTITKGS